MNEEDFIQLEKYLDGTMSEAERQAFEQRLTDDNALSQAHEQRLKVGELLRREAAREKIGHFLKQVRDSESNAQASEPKETKIVPIWRKRSFRIAAIALAAAIALILVVPFLLQGDLYEKYSVHEPMATTVQSDQNDQLLQEAQTAFNAANYEEAAVALATYLEENGEDVEARLYYGISLLETQNTTEAERLFSEIADGSSAFVVEGFWYLALTHLKVGDKEKCRAILEQLIEKDQNASLSEKARDLLVEL